MHKLWEKNSGLPIVSGTALKIIAMVGMTVEHFAKIVLAYVTGAVWGPMLKSGLLTDAEFSRIDDFVHLTLYKVGDIAYPLFFLLVAEGYRHTRDRKKYLARMFLFALISELPFDLGFFSVFSAREGTFPFYWEYQNVLFTYFFAIACLYGMDQIKGRFAGAEGRQRILPAFFAGVCLIAAGGLAELLQCDYGAFGVITVVLLYWLRDRRVLQACAVLLADSIATGSQPNGFLLAAALAILLYSGKRGKAMPRYFFYLYYPAHIFLFYLVTLAVPTFSLQ